MEKILITGASGFIGQKLCRRLIKLNRNVYGTVRDSNSISSNLENFTIGDIGLEANWENALKDVSCIIHCAGKAHVMNKKDDTDSYRLINTEGTKFLAEQASKNGVKRLIFLSSIKVNGENSDKIYNDYKNNLFENNEKSNPQDFYAKSKLEAEKVLWEISLRTNLEVVVLRLPLVYGYGVKGNLLQLIKLIKSGIPLPFGLIKNKRSLIGVDNLIDLLICCIDQQNASGKTFLVSDGVDLSTQDLIRHLATAMEKSVNIFPFPLSILKFAGFCLGFQSEMDRLLGSLQVDIEYTKEVLDWKPPFSVVEGFKKMVQGE
jgi:nucleoside-diphosphate-sugar epimerase